MELKIVFESENRIPKLSLRIEVENLKIKSMLQNVNPNSFTQDYLTACGIENVERYLSAGRNEIQSPTCYLNIDAAADRLHQAIENCERIGILVDEDNDGICSAVIIYNLIKSQKLISKPIFHSVPKAHGIKFGGGENLIFEIERLKLNLLIVPDASADVESCRHLKEIGVDVLIIDHHQYDFESNPYAIIVNCMQQADTNHAASGALVTSKLVDYYCEKYCANKPNNIDLVAMTISSDVMSLIDGFENRAYCNIAMEEYKKI